MTLASEVNPLGQVGLSYCQCVAVTVNGCKTPQVDFLAVPVAGQAMISSGIAGLQMNAANIEAQLTGGVDVARGDLSQEYAAVDMYIREATGGTTTAAAATFDKQSEADTVQALLDSLPSSVDQCATMAFDFIE